MKYLCGLLILLGLLSWALVSCQSTNTRQISSKKLNLENESYLIIQNEINGLLEKTNDLKRFKVVRPKVF